MVGRRTVRDGSGSQARLYEMVGRRNAHEGRWRAKRIRGTDAEASAIGHANCNYTTKARAIFVPVQYRLPLKLAEFGFRFTSARIFFFCWGNDVGCHEI